MTDGRNARRTLIGTVASSKGDKTITVVVERTFKHQKYNKYVRKRKKYHAHDELNSAGVGDQVEIVSTRPLSKLKRWRLGSIVQAAPDRGIEVAQITADARLEAGLDQPAVPAVEAVTESNP